jgi:hypothetical protein
VRTNPKLTANVKLVTNGDNLYLESFNANTQLSSSKFKAFKISGDSTYDQDVHRFFNLGDFPKDLAFQLYQQFSDTDVLPSYKDQYEMSYSAGTDAVSSESYAEDMGMLAPLWLNDSIPNYFVIFRMDDPIAVNNLTATNQNDGEILAQTSVAFNKNVLENCTAIKTFDLGPTSKLGKYLRNYKNQKDFPSAPLTTSWRKDEPIQWNGISYDKGGFTSKGIHAYNDLIVHDTTIMNNEFYFTQGFEKNGIMVANLINLQFLFSDEYADEYSMNRYFGLYVNTVEEGSFNISGSGFYQGFEKSQTPKITSENQVSEQLNTTLMLENPNGILLYLNPDSISTVTGMPTPARVNEVESIFYVKDKFDQFHTIKKGSRWESNQLRLFDKKIDISSLAGYKQPDSFASALQINQKGNSIFSIKVLGEIPQGATFTFYDGTNQIAQICSDPTTTSGPGASYYHSFNPHGTVQEITRAITSAINVGIPVGKRFFNASYNNDTVYVISRYGGSRFNRLNVSVSWNDYPDLNVHTYPLTSAAEENVNFIGGGDVKGGLIRVTKGDEARFMRGHYVKTKGGFASILDHTPYTHEPITDAYGNIIGYNNIDKYVLIGLDASDVYISSTGQVALYSDYKPTFGRFSFYPVKDFDFDFYNKDYSDEGELAWESLYYNRTNPAGDIIGVGTDPDTLNFYKNGGFANLLGLLNRAEPDKTFDVLIQSEYQRLEENYLTSQAVASRVVPYINKWGYYNDGRNVRNKPYRLNLSEAFTLNNFAPSQYDYTQSAYGFSHEWYYLSKIPGYFTIDAIADSWSYFNTAPIDSIEANPILDTPYVPGTFQDTVKNGFDEFFIVDKLYYGSTPVLIDRQLRYSKFSGGENENFAQTFLRGVKVIAKPKSRPEDKVNFNSKTISFVRDGSLNGYKFSTVLVPNSTNKANTEIKFVKNDKWKTITMMIFLSLDYICFNDGQQFVDRTMLYSASNSLLPSSSVCEFIYPTGSTPSYTDGVMQGALRFDISGPYAYDNTQILLRGQPNIDGIPTKFLTDITVGADGQYNKIQFSITTGSTSDNYEISGISKILSDDKLLCTTVKKNGVQIALPSPSPIGLVLQEATYITVNGGYQLFKNRLNNISFASIYNSVNQGDPTIIYETIDVNGNPVKNSRGELAQTFMIQLQAQDDILKSMYVGVVPDQSKPTVFNLIDVIGYSLSLQPKPRVTPIARHSGRYEPISKDLFFFRDPYLQYDFTGYVTGSTGVTYNTSTGEHHDEDYKVNVFNLTRYANTQFHSNDLRFGQIKNMFYHKVNTQDSSTVLELSSNSAFLSLYPLINEVGIDFRDFYTFSSNWDPGYFRSSEDKFVIIPEIGTRSMTEQKSFFGSKYLKVPQQIQLETFTPSDFNQDAIKQPSLVSGTFMWNEDSVKISAWLFIEKRLINYLFPYVKTTFSKYINPLFGFGDQQSLDDDVIQYIRKNVLSLYKVGTIEFFTRESRTIQPTNVNTAELTNHDKFTAGLNINRNFSSQLLNTNQFDISLIYNKKTGFSEDIGFSVTIVKK